MTATPAPVPPMKLSGLEPVEIGQGTLFADASMLLGEHLAFLELRLDSYRGVLLMILPPGGFLALGFLVAARQRMLAEQDAAPMGVEARLARLTGELQVSTLRAARSEEPEAVAA